MKAMGAYGPGTPVGLQAMRDKLLDVGRERLASVDEAGIDVQVLPLASPGLPRSEPAQGTDVLHDIHDELAAAVKAHTRRRC